MPIIRFCALCLFAAGVVLLPACGDKNSTQALLQDYLRRVENATGITSQAEAKTPLYPYPSRQERALPMTRIRIGLLNYFKFYDCRFFRLINERNSIMGKVMPISQRLNYEIAFLQGAEECYRQLNRTTPAEEPFMLEFRRVIEQKSADLANIFWNATFDSPELQQTFSLAVSPLKTDEQVGYAPSKQALDYFYRLGQRLGQPIGEVDLDELENHYYALQRYSYGGRLFQTLRQFIDYLNKASFALENAIAGRPLCYQRRANQKARILENIFHKYYIGAVHDHSAQIYQQGRDWLRAVNRLIDVQAVALPPAFASYRRQMLALDGGLWQSYKTAVERHARAWQALLDQCGLAPGSKRSLSAAAR